MRIPGIVCIILCVLAFGLTYWFGSKEYDFATPPEEVEVVEKNVPQSAPQEAVEPTEQVDPVIIDPVVETIEEPEDPPEEEVVMEPSHPSDYIDLESKSVESYVKLAEDLVAKQKPEHSLVAWERVLDSAQASPETIKEAFEILKLHKPVIRNEDSGIAISISLHASVPADLLERMEKLLRRTALIIELGSGYSLSVTPEVSVVAVRKGKPRPPVSVWFSGKNESTRGSLHTKSAKDLGLDDKVNTTIFNIVGPFIDEYSELTPVQDIHNEINVEEALAYLITRHSWRQFGLLLYQNLEQE